MAFKDGKATGMGTAMVLAFVVLWNSGFIGAEFVLPHTGPFSLMFWRYWALVLLLAGVLVISGRLRWPGLSEATFEAAIGVLAHGVWLGCVIFALHGGVPAGIVALVVALQPMTTGALSGLLTGESVSARSWAGLFVAFAGVAVVVMARVDFADAGSITAYLLPFGSVLAITLASLFYLGPPVTMLMSWLAFGDTLIATDVAGLLIVAAGVALVQREKPPL